ncbi:hypothetical protein N7519_003883 [Penicillium mononematosum]|uniref:uncharacterized protein n=1 Tax=Penicillium mononematosum TaxID=268346 RepID=UPI0025496A47|nr:uncharacterized protein N7519_003883 [Penicillium mononematosum]KAJ6188975.1 hypothetical protein N7519_003883 [Penicillium mononematosum]
MAGASLDWADKPNADLALSSDEEDFVSSPSTASRELEGVAKQNLTLALGKLRLEQEGLNQSSEQDATPTTPRTEGPNHTPPEPEMAKTPLQLLDLPLDILKEIIKEVTQVFPEIPDSDPGNNRDRFRSRRGNHYAQYTRTFSIGNGPLSWVQEYSVTKEVGKMLGTLVALAVARMVNLEAFVWDMPTGVVREIWLALASLADRPGHDCRLERIWVRWHDNSENALRSSSAAATRLFQKYKHVEHPSLSVLPPLKSVAVLDIDEPAYVEELALLIERSRHRLSELRIGIAEKAHMSAWLQCGKDSTGSTGWPRADGVLGILTRRHLDKNQDNAIITSLEDSSMPSEGSINKSLNSTESAAPLNPNGEQQPPSTTNDKKSPPNSGVPNRSTRPQPPSYKLEYEILYLKVLELERVPLSVPTLLPAVDWTGLTTLTIMRCEDHEKLWRALRRKYAPPAMPAKRPQDAERRASASSVEYSLNLKHIRTDTVSPYLILFIKDALAPNTLESVYLHEAPGHESAVHIDAIYKHILRKHRQSLRKVLIDATDRIIGDGYSGTRWHKWMFNHDMVSFVTSGKMPQLKELGMAMHYRDWHFFLQRLPNMSQLRALFRRQPRDWSFPTHSEDDDEGWANPDHESEEDSDASDDASGAADTDLLSSDPDYDTEPDEEQGASRVRYRLQEILFYDEKVSIFKARHGVL